ncbi:MAG: hypothetical protein WDN75_07075 [Bacteroidota bacterium]
MTIPFYFVGILLVGEIIVHILLFLVSKFIGKANKDKISRTSILKGILERIFIVVTLHFKMTQSLTLLGALKIATRIKDEDKISNDFFLIGNLISVLSG